MDHNKSQIRDQVLPALKLNAQKGSSWYLELRKSNLKDFRITHKENFYYEISTKDRLGSLLPHNSYDAWKELMKFSSVQVGHCFREANHVVVFVATNAIRRFRFDVAFLFLMLIFLYLFVRMFQFGLELRVDSFLFKKKKINTICMIHSDPCQIHKRDKYCYTTPNFPSNGIQLITNMECQIHKIKTR